MLVRNVDERPAQDYILRKLEVTRLDRVRSGGGNRGLNQSRPTDPGSDYLALMRTRTDTHTIPRLALTRGSRAPICVSGGKEEKTDCIRAQSLSGFTLSRALSPEIPVQCWVSAFLHRIGEQSFLRSPTLTLFGRPLVEPSWLSAVNRAVAVMVVCCFSRSFRFAVRNVPQNLGQSDFISLAVPSRQHPGRERDIFFYSLFEIPSF